VEYGTAAGGSIIRRIVEVSMYCASTSTAPVSGECQLISMTDGQISAAV